ATESRIPVGRVNPEFGALAVIGMPQFAEIARDNHDGGARGRGCSRVSARLRGKWNHLRGKWNQRQRRIRSRFLPARVLGRREAAQHADASWVTCASIRAAAPCGAARATPRRSQRAVLTIRPVGSTNQRSLLTGLPLSRATSQSATSTGGKGPRLAAGTLPTECRLSA